MWCLCTIKAVNIMYYDCRLVPQHHPHPLTSFFPQLQHLHLTRLRQLLTPAFLHHLVDGRLCSALLSVLIFFGIVGAQAIWVNFQMSALSGSAGMRVQMLRELVASLPCGWWRLNGALARTSGQIRDTTLHGVLVKTLLYIFIHIILLSRNINLSLQARQKWSQFQFFISRIETSISTGLTASQAVQALEDRRLMLSMPQLHRKLQSKRQKKDKVNASFPESTAPSSGDVIMAT